MDARGATRGLADPPIGACTNVARGVVSVKSEVLVFAVQACECGICIESIHGTDDTGARL